MTNAAIDASPSFDDEGDIDYSSSHPSLESKSRDVKIVEADRRRHRQLLRKRDIKPSCRLADKYREKGDVITKRSLISKGKPSMGKDSGINSIGQLIGKNTGNVKISDKARRLLELGGY